MLQMKSGHLGALLTLAAFVLLALTVLVESARYSRSQAMLDELVKENRQLLSDNQNLIFRACSCEGE